jgi:hypothetical protein
MGRIAWLASAWAVATGAALGGCGPDDAREELTSTTASATTTGLLPPATAAGTEPFVPPTGSTTSDGSGSSGSESDASGTAASTTEPPGLTSGASSETDGTVRFDVGPAPEPFPPVQPFGDDVRELDLVGTWGSPWTATGEPTLALALAGDGAFVLRETDGACAELRRGEGLAWVEGRQLVLRVDAWTGPLPWPTAAEIGESFTAPFELRLGYALLGDALGLAAPPGFRSDGAWAGRGYGRVAAGQGPEGEWVTESELWGVPSGQRLATLIVRDRYEASLASGGAALLRAQSTYWYPGPDASPRAPTEQSGTWVDTTPGNSAGAATVVGQPHAYDARSLIPFASGPTLRRAAATGCPDPG